MVNPLKRPVLAHLGSSQLGYTWEWRTVELHVLELHVPSSFSVVQASMKLEKKAAQVEMAYEGRHDCAHH